MFQWNTVHSVIFTFPSYLFFAGLGIMPAALLYPFLLYSRKEPVKIFFPRILLSSLFLLIGAKTAGIIVSVLNALQQETPITIETFLQTGIVFYGGLLGLIVSFYVICLRKDGRPPTGAWEALAVIIPLFHSVARIGCFCAGCCYGIETESAFSVYYIIEENGVLNASYRIPIQLIESACNFMLFVVLLVLFLKHWQNGKLMRIYLLSYAGIRFILEFFRGDTVRGVFWGISFSQIISMMIIAVLAVQFFKRGSEKQWRKM